MARKPHDPGDKTRIFLVDDEPAILRGLELLLAREPYLLLCGSAASPAEALQSILMVAPDLVVVDLHLKEHQGCELLRQLRRLQPQLRLLVFSLHDQPSLAQEALEAGANGYITKEEGTDKLLEAIARVAAGDCYVTASVAARMPPGSHPAC